MRFICDAEACGSCGLVEGEPDACAFAGNEISLTQRWFALNRLGSHLITDAEAMEREHFVVPRRN